MEIDAFEELSKWAYKGEQLSELAILADKYMFLKLVDLYDSFAKWKYDKEEFVKIKNKFKM